MAAMNTPTLRGSTTVVDGIEEDKTYRRSEVSVLGDTAKLSTYDPDKGRLVEVDQLSRVTVDTARNGVVTIKGVSKELTTEIGLDAENGLVTWKMTPRGCSTC